MTVEQTTVDPAKVQATLGKVVEELGVALGTLTPRSAGGPGCGRRWPAPGP